jgi:hypothetical protein
MSHADKTLEFAIACDGSPSTHASSKNWAAGDRPICTSRISKSQYLENIGPLNL